MILYRILQIVFFVIFKFFFNLEVKGKRHIPGKGGAILASNHASYADILLIGCGIRRRLRYVAKAEMFRSVWSRILWTHLGGIPINRRGVSGESFRQIFNHLLKGHLVVIFPEGTRSKDEHLKDGKMGIGMIAAMSGAKIIPTYISGSGRVLPAQSTKVSRHPVRVTYGTPVEFRDLMHQFEGKELYQAISRRIMEKIRELKEREENQRTWQSETKQEAVHH